MYNSKKRDETKCEKVVANSPYVVREVISPKCGVMQKNQTMKDKKFDKQLQSERYHLQKAEDSSIASKYSAIPLKQFVVEAKGSAETRNATAKQRPISKTVASPTAQAKMKSEASGTSEAARQYLQSKKVPQKEESVVHLKGRATRSARTNEQESNYKTDAAVLEQCCGDNAHCGASYPHPPNDIGESDSVIDLKDRFRELRGNCNEEASDNHSFQYKEQIHNKARLINRNKETHESKNLVTGGVRSGHQDGTHNTKQKGAVNTRKSNPPKTDTPSSGESLVSPGNIQEATRAPPVLNEAGDSREEDYSFTNCPHRHLSKMQLTKTLRKFRNCRDEVKELIPKLKNALIKQQTEWRAERRLSTQSRGALDVEQDGMKCMVLKAAELGNIELLRDALEEAQKHDVSLFPDLVYWTNCLFAIQQRLMVSEVLYKAILQEDTVQLEIWVGLPFLEELGIASSHMREVIYFLKQQKLKEVCRFERYKFFTESTSFLTATCDAQQSRATPPHRVKVTREIPTTGPVQMLMEGPSEDANGQGKHGRMEAARFQTRERQPVTKASKNYKLEQIRAFIMTSKGDHQAAANPTNSHQKQRNMKAKGYSEANGEDSDCCRAEAAEESESIENIRSKGHRKDKRGEVFSSEDISDNSSPSLENTESTEIPSNELSYTMYENAEMTSDLEEVVASKSHLYHVKRKSSAAVRAPPISKA